MDTSEACCRRDGEEQAKAPRHRCGNAVETKSNFLFTDRKTVKQLINREEDGTQKM